MYPIAFAAAAWATPALVCHIFLLYYIHSIKPNLGRVLVKHGEHCLIARIENPGCRPHRMSFDHAINAGAAVLNGKVYFVSN
jgi:hypothetical protein